MFEIGVVKDAKLAKEIQSLARGRGIEIELSEEVRAGEKLTIMRVQREEDVPEAYNIYRVSIGRPPKREVPREWVKLRELPLGTLTKTFLGISILLYIYISINPQTEIFQLFLFSESEHGFFSEIRQGQWWRLWTPAFLHFHILHILFNMLWLKDLGKIYEHQWGMGMFAIFFLVCAGFSNVAQYVVQGPYFGGMSGVVYGLLGQLWMYKTFHPESEFSLPKADIYLMIGWFFLCMTGLIGNIANTAHGLGLGIGMLFGIWQGGESENVSPSLPYAPFIQGRPGFSTLAFFIVFLTLSVEYAKSSGRFFYPLF